MKKLSIAYFIKPSFDKEKRLYFGILWIEHKCQYVLHIKEGSQELKEYSYDSNIELEEIINESSKLQLPFYATCPSVLDGTSYEFEIRGCPTASTSYHWSQKLPEEWSALKKILDHIDRIINKHHQGEL